MYLQRCLDDSRDIQRNGTPFSSLVRCGHDSLNPPNGRATIMNEMAVPTAIEIPLIKDFLSLIRH